MKNKFFFVLVTIFFLTSCQENNIPIYGHVLGKEKAQNLELQIKKTDTNIHFDYAQKIDSLKDINLKYNPKEAVIIVDVDTFKKIENIYKTKNVDFNMYQGKKDKNGHKTFVFNEDYGLFATLGFESDCLFLKDSMISFSVKEFTFKDLYVSLNNIE